MCGFTGFLSHGAPPDNAGGVLRSMTKALAHRGPDSEGYVEANPIYLGHRRLEVIDLEGGAQPFHAGDFVVVFNGEIYNYESLREELEALGESFETQSDTEVLAKALCVWGKDALSRFNGMFAFAAWNGAEQSLLLARDRMGQKPLYFFQGKEGVVFASELTALLEHPWVPRQVSLSGLRKYLLFDYVPSPGSMVEGVCRLEPGSWVELGSFGERRGTYWSFPEEPEVAQQPLNEILSDAVKLRLRSDVPLGIFLSGGLDSSCLAALARRHVPSDQLHTFSIGFEDKSFDESSHARRVADHLGTIHHERVLSTDEMLRVLPRVLEQLDEPMADGSFVPTYLLSEFTREHVTVALGGDGGDELFMGYPTFHAHRIASLLNGIPRVFWSKFVGPMLRHLPVSTQNISIDYQLKRFAQGMAYGPYERHFVWIGALDPSQQAQVLSDDVLASLSDQQVFEDVERWVGDSPWEDSMRTLSALYARLYLADDILVKVDRASMAHGLEARAPFLDHRVVEAAFGLPTWQKIRGRSSKVALRELCRRDLPAEILSRPKKGFGMPIADWLKGPLQAWAYEALDPDRLAQTGLFKPESGRALLCAHTEGRADHRKILWSLLVFLSWWDRTLKS